MKNLLIALVALSIGVFAMPTFATELSFTGVIDAFSNNSLTDYLVSILVTKIAANPLVALILAGLSAALPLIGFIANRTSNPLDNAALILINKVLQTLAFNTSKNQPDVLSWKELLTNKPSNWPLLIEDKVITDTGSIRAKIFKK